MIIAEKVEEVKIQSRSVESCHWQALRPVSCSGTAQLSLSKLGNMDVGEQEFDHGQAFRSLGSERSNMELLSTAAIQSKFIIDSENEESVEN